MLIINYLMYQYYYNLIKDNLYVIIIKCIINVKIKYNYYNL